MTYRDILRQYWGYDDFRGIQGEIIESIGGGRDTLGLMPTGGGKSVTFQVPAIAKEGVCVVITPLIALMKDQVEHLRARGIRAATVHSGMTADEIEVTLDNSVLGGVKILYVSPERLESELFLTKFRHMNVSFLTVDEAHCISQWGYDFRPSYLKIAAVRKLKPGMPVLALTATATPRVVDDIQRRLEFKDGKVLRMSFERKNLSYIVRCVSDKMEELSAILAGTEGSAIVYVRSRRRTKEISDMLQSKGISSTFYHAGLMHGERDARQRLWSGGGVRVIVATNAFGMGIDKPDVRIVAHIDCPDSIEAYFQEAGRAGRDGKHSDAILLYNPADGHKLRRRVEDTYPPKEYVRRVYEHLAYFFQVGTGSGCGASFDFSMDNFCRAYRFFPVQVDAALKILTRAGYIFYDCDSDTGSRVMFRIGRDELNRLEHISGNESLIMTALLRSYGGLFTSFRYIDETDVARQTGLTCEQVYMALKDFSGRHLLSYIPRRDTPRITFTRSREDMENVVLPPEVYDERKSQFRQRIGQMLNYAANSHVCRSRFLLAYFGETDASDCGQCDVCAADAAAGNGVQEEEVRERIMAMLGDGCLHPVYELLGIRAQYGVIDRVLREMTAEEVVEMENGLVRVAAVAKRHPGTAAGSDNNNLSLS